MRFSPTLAFLIILTNIVFAKDENSDIQGKILIGGLERTYTYHLPNPYNPYTKHAIVFVLHGGGGTGENMVKHTFGKFDRLSDKEGFIVIYPDGIEKHWNDGRNDEETKYRAQKENIDDVGFISALIDKFCLDMNGNDKQVYVSGISNGAMMSLRLACELTNKIKAIAIVAGNMPEELLKTCSPSKEISVIAFHGIEDPIMPFQGGEIDVPLVFRKLGKVVSANNTISYWVKNNHCSEQPLITELPDLDLNDETKVKRLEYLNGINGTKVISYLIEGGGHTWPGGNQYLSKRMVGRVSKDIDATELIWEFFSSFAK